MRLDIGLALDKNYQTQIYILIKSILVNNPLYDITFHILWIGCSKKDKESIKGFAEGTKITFYEIDDSDFDHLITMSEWTKAVYLKLFLPLLIPPTIGKLLYLDMDTLVIGPLDELFNINMIDKPVACVYDNYVRSQPLIDIEEGNYFNSGVMLINVSLWNQLRISEQTLEYVTSNPDRIKYVDQCGLNAVLKDKWYKIPNRFNLLYSYVPKAVSYTDLKTFLRDKVIIHFTLQRPWNYLCKNRVRNLYYEYLVLAGQGRKYTDFSWGKIPAKLKINLIEFYYDISIVKKVWRFIKHLMVLKKDQ